MLREEIVIDPDVFYLGPRSFSRRRRVQIVYFRSLHRKQKRRVRGNNELAVICPDGRLQKALQFQLKLSRQAVFGLVEQIQSVFFYLFGILWNTRTAYVTLFELYRRVVCPIL